MNIIFLSPHFPPNFYLFCVGLRKLGVNVLGIGEASYGELRPELQWALTEYYSVPNMEDYRYVVAACHHFIHRYGSIDRVESHNEHWLELEAQLRTDFNIWGVRLDQVQSIKLKSQMKPKFIEAGAEVARGRVATNIEEAEQFINEVGYPIVAKPNKGVGASDTYKIHNADEFRNFMATSPNVHYFLEEFIDGRICSFDGLLNHDGDAVFYTVHQNYDNVMEIVHEDRHTAYYSLRNIPEDVKQIACSTLKALEIGEKFFHIEFFRTSEQRLVALEVNMRPPGGFTIDMFNYANNIDLYQEWANVVVYNHFKAKYNWPYHCCYVSRKNNKNYIHSHQEILSKFAPWIMHHSPLHPMYWQVMGHYCYIVRDENLDKIIEIKEFVHKIH